MIIIMIIYCGCDLKVKNLLPSVSSAISFDGRTTLFWLLCILLHSPFRFMLAKRLNFAYKNYFAKIYKAEYLANLNFADYKSVLRMRNFTYFSLQVNRIEIAGLIILSLFPSHGIFGKIIYFFLSLFKISLTYIINFNDIKKYV